MNKRRSRRKIVSINSELIPDFIGEAGVIEDLPAYGTKRIKWYKFTGVVENLSNQGVYIRTFPAKVPIDYYPGTTLELKFQLLSGEALSLNCRVKWSIKIPPDDLTSRMGMEILNPSPNYNKLLKIL